MRQHIGAETLDYTEDSVIAELKERTGGRGPDVCIEAVGMEAHGTGPHVPVRPAQAAAAAADRPARPPLREAIYACRKGGSLFVLGVFGGLVDKFPFGAIMNKGMTVRGAQQHGHRYIPMILERIAAGELSTEHLATHVMPLDQGPQGYADVQEQAGRLRPRRLPARRSLRLLVIMTRPGPDLPLRRSGGPG